MLVGTTYRTGPLRSAWRLRLLCPCCHCKRKKVQISHQLLDLFNICFHTAAHTIISTAALQLSREGLALPSSHPSDVVRLRITRQSICLSDCTGSSLCNPSCYPHCRHMSLNPAAGNRRQRSPSRPVPTRVTFTRSVPWKDIASGGAGQQLPVCDKWVCHWEQRR